MNDLATLLIPALAETLLAFVVQGTVIGLFASTALILLRRSTPQARYAVACVALLACVITPALQFEHSINQRQIDVFVTQSGDITAARPVIEMPGSIFAGSLSVDLAATLTSLPSSAMPWIVALWASGALLLSLRMAGGLWWIRGVRAAAAPLADGRWQTRFAALARRIGVRRHVALRLMDQGESPVSAGIFTPVVLVPTALMLRMPADLLEALLAHELAHIRRHDYLVNLVQSAVEVMLFYHPVVWWLSRRIRIERELVADDIAATALGDRRRLAIALAELDCQSAPLSTFVQAANGGQLMSRIKQLVRPDVRTIGGMTVLPFIGILAASMACYAEVHLDTESAGTERTAESTGNVPRASERESVPDAAGKIASLVGGSREPDRGYALVRKGREGFAISGSVDDIDAIRAIRGRVDTDFLWFRRGANAYVVRDAAVLARAERAWAPVDALEVKMQALDARMQPHSRKMEQLGERMEVMGKGFEESSDMREASRQMERIGRQQGAIGERQSAVALAMVGADAVERDRLSKDMDKLAVQMDTLSNEMETHAKVMESHSRKMQAQSKPMEALGRQMETAGKPMEAIGKEMEVLGKDIERVAKIADGEIQVMIDDAIARGLATPAPSLR